MKKTIELGTFPSPGAPDYRENGVNSQKGWCSERVPLPAHGSRRHVGSASLTPFYSGRALPSKWEDAERWIRSPISGYGVSNGSNSQFQRRVKSKSGPIVPPEIGYYSSCSPAIQVLGGGGGSVRNFMVGSPFSTGVLMADRVSSGYSNGGTGGGGGQPPFLVENGSNVTRSASGPGWSDVLSESSLPSSEGPDEKIDEIMNEETAVSRVISRRDMATQMSPEGSTHSSPRAKSSYLSPSASPVEDLRSGHPSKLEIREVQVDKQTTMISWSKRHKSRIIKESLPDFEDFYPNNTGTHIPSWDVSEAATNDSKLQREEAKISAWENLQKAKAEAAIRKLEMKLEKKRSSSMDKILTKLKMAQMKAQEMRNSMSVRQEQQITKWSHKVIFFRKHSQRTSLRSCFRCQAL